MLVNIVRWNYLVTNGGRGKVILERVVYIFRFLFCFRYLGCVSVTGVGVLSCPYSRNSLCSTLRAT